MRPVVAGAIVTLALLASPAAAQRLRLAVSDCGGAAAATWTCDTNEGTALDVVASVISPAITVLIGQESTIEFWFGGPVPDWWKVGTGQCRPSQAVAVSFDGSATSCVDIMAEAGVWGGYSYLIGPQSDPEGLIDKNRLRVRTGSSVLGIVPPEYGTVAEGAELFLFRLTIDRRNMVSAGACSGCDACAFLLFRQVVLHQPAGIGDFALSDTAALFALQAGPGGGVNCPTTATTRSTWGHVKSLYR